MILTLFESFDSSFQASFNCITRNLLQQLSSCFIFKSSESTHGMIINYVRNHSNTSLRIQQLPITKRTLLFLRLTSTPSTNIFLKSDRKRFPFIDNPWELFWLKGTWKASIDSDNAYWIIKTSRIIFSLSITLFTGSRFGFKGRPERLIG